MKGFISVTKEDVVLTVGRAIESIISLRNENLDKEIKNRLKIPRERTLVERIKREPVSFPLRDEVMEDLHRDTKYFGSRYSWIMGAYGDTMKDLNNLRKATLLADGNILVCLETAAFLQRFKETE